MKRKVKIDDIYKEKLGGLENPPPADSWDIILSRLPEKRKNRIAPLWYKLGGVAAAIALLALLFNDFFQEPISSSPSISVEEKREIFNPNPTSVNFEKYMREAGITLENIITESGNSHRKHQEKNSPSSGSKVMPAGERKDNISSMVSSSPSKNQPQPLAEAASPFEQSLTSNLTKEPKEDKITGPLSGFKPIVLEEQEFTTPNPIAENTATVNGKINEIIAKSEEKEEVVDNSLLEKRFSLTTGAGAVYMGKFGKGNLLASQFDGLQDEARVSASYGIHLAYQLSNNLKIRSGLRKVNFSYNTQNLDLVTVGISQAVTTEFGSLSTEIEPSAPGSLEQGFGYIEIPLEMEYALVNKKIEINLIGGVSSFFLQENKVSFTEGINTANLGEARSLNDLSFSANIGLGLNYHLSRQFQFNLEPLFKYQINTFDNSVDVNSYFLGINSGLRFKF